MRSYLLLLTSSFFLLSQGCVTAYKTEFEEKKTSRFSQREPIIYTFYYPDSIINRKLHIYQRFNKTRQEYVELHQKTEYFERKTPYIRPIDTTIIDSERHINQVFHRIYFRTESLTFNESGTFTFYGEGMSTCTTMPKYYRDGKYSLIHDTLTLYTQIAGSLKIDTTIYLYSADSLLRIADNRLHNEKYYTRK